MPERGLASPAFRAFWLVTEWHLTTVVTTVRNDQRFTKSRNKRLQSLPSVKILTSLSLLFVYTYVTCDSPFLATAGQFSHVYRQPIIFREYSREFLLSRIHLDSFHLFRSVPRVNTLALSTLSVRKAHRGKRKCG